MCRFSREKWIGQHLWYRMINASIVLTVIVGNLILLFVLPDSIRRIIMRQEHRDVSAFDCLLSESRVLIICASRPSAIAKATNTATHPTRTISGNASGVWTRQRTLGLPLPTNLMQLILPCYMHRSYIIFLNSSGYRLIPRFWFTQFFVLQFLRRPNHESL